MSTTTPHKWADAIHAYADGKRIQWHFIGSEADWIDWYYADGSPSFDVYTLEFRVKPELRVMRYRTALMRSFGGDPYVAVANNDDEAEFLIEQPRFDSWLDSWQTFEMPE